MAARGEAIHTVLITGVATNLTVEQTARHATDLGFTAYVVSDAVTAIAEEAHNASIENLRLTSAGPLTAAEVLAALR